MARGIHAGLLALACAWLATPAAAQSGADQPWPPPGVSYDGDRASPDISGLWLGTITGVPGESFGPGRGPADGRPATFWAPWPLPYTPPFQKIYDTRVAMAKQGKALGDTSASCMPFGLPRMLISKVYPDEITQTPGVVTFWMNNTFPIMVWTDGRGHPQDVKPSYNGHSIGTWVGDTLFVDTVGITDKASLDSARDPHSDKMHIRWTVRRVASDVLHVTVTLDDADAFTMPVVTTNIWQRKTDARWQILDDASCFENNGSSDEHGEAGFIKF